MKQNLIFFTLSVIVVAFILLAGIFLAEQLLLFAFISLFLALLLMGFGFYIKRKWKSP